MKTALVRLSAVVGLGLLVLAVMFLLLTSGALTPAAATDKEPNYIGSETCAKVCHKTAKQGEQLRIWQESLHAKAFATLGSEAAKAIAKEKGIADPQKADECLACHVTAHGVVAERLEAKYSHEEGVGCERCHGPGSDYKKMSIMKDREKSVAAGLWLPDEKTCLECHNEKSPTFKGFKYEEMWEKIAHPKPAAG